MPLANDSRKLAYEMLEKCGVAVVPGIAFGPSGESHIRINYGRDWDILKTGLQRISEYLTDSKHKAVASPGSSANRPFQKQLGRSILARSAKFYLKKLSPTVIGIVGTKGKTTFKRTVCRLLAEHYKVRSNILSYNTATGLPLSVLGLKSPRSFKSLLALPFKIFWKLFLTNEKVDFLILEYGISNTSEAKQLLDIARPDWLIVSEISNHDPGLACQDIRKGVKILVESLPEEKVIWCQNDPLVSSLSDTLKPNLAIDIKKISDSTLNTSSRSYDLGWEPIGSSAQEAIIASVIMGEQLRVPEQKIEHFLATEHSDIATYG